MRPADETEKLLLGLLPQTLPAWPLACCSPGVPNPAHVPTVKSLAAEVARLRGIVSALVNEPRLHAKDLLLRYQIHKSTLYRWWKAGRLPAPAVRFYGPMWSQADLEAAEASGRLPQGIK